MLVNLYLKSIRTPLPEPDSLNLPLGRLERAKKYRRPEDRMRCLAAGFLLSERLNVHSDDDLIYSAYGKPMLRSGAKCFNLSHSGDYAALAVADTPIGVDIELIQPFDRQIVDECFTAQERLWLRERETDAAFFKLWTAKEAVMKAIGMGLSLHPLSFCVLPADASAHIVRGQSWYLRSARVDEHMLCAAAGAPFSLCLRREKTGKDDIMRIITERLSITPVSESELRLLADKFKLSAPELGAAYGEMLENCQKHPGEYLWYAPWKMCLREGGEEVGYAGFKGLSAECSAEIGYGTNEGHEGRGYATECVKALCGWAVREKPGIRIEAETEADNEASKRVLAKTGFLPTGEYGQEGPRYVLSDANLKD